jgi:uracil-DNA glycosylase
VSEPRRRLPVLIGEAPVRGRDEHRAWPLHGRSAQVLCGLAGIDAHDDEPRPAWAWTWALYDHFECRNLFRAHGEAEPWRVRAARERALSLALDLRGAVVVCLGRRVHDAVCSALGLGAPAFHEWVEDASGRRVAGIPHPSGLNRLLNEPAERERCGETLRAAMARAACP